MSVLDDIIAGVRTDLAQRQSRVSLDTVVSSIDDAPPVRDPWPAFQQAGISVIAEVKRHSPSKGHLAEIADPGALASHYETGGAAAISVLTEQRRFHGDLEDLDIVRSQVETPLLRKDFIVTEYQVYESRSHGADLILLIVAALDDDELRHLYRLATDLGMRVLVETHTREEVSRAIDLGAELIGVNNRNLKTLEVDLQQFSRLATAIPDNVLKVAESGIFTTADVEQVYGAGADIVLVGEALVRDGHPADTVARFRRVGTH